MYRLGTGWMVLGIVLLLISCGGVTGNGTDVVQEETVRYDPLKPLPMQMRKRVMILHSYDPEYVWVQNLNKGILMGLREERFEEERNILLDYFYMDTKRNVSAAWKEKSAAKVIERIHQWRPDVVIATDDNAQIHVVSRMKDSGIPFVFAGVNGDPTSYFSLDSLNRPDRNVTGCLERARFEQTMKLLWRLAPGVRRLAVVCDDGPTGVPVIERVKTKAPALGLEIVAARQIGRFSEWKRFVLAQQDRADALLVIVYHTLRDEAGQHVPAENVLRWTVNNSRLPDIGFWPWAIEGGLLCSEAISGYQQGHYAGTVASYVLRGQTPGDFKVDMPRRGEICINRARAKMLGITIPLELAKSAIVFNTLM